MSRTTMDFISRSLDFAHRAFADARNGTAQQLHFVPERGSHSIAWCLWHTARIEDLIVNVRIRGGSPIWSKEWAEHCRLPFEGVIAGMPDEEAQRVRIEDVAAFGEYQEAVWAQTEAYLALADDADLDRIVPARDGEESVGQAIQLHLLGHFNGHRGEINLLRGMQGMPTVLVREGTH